MSGTGQVEDTAVMRLDDAVHVHIDEVEPWCRSKVAEEPQLDMLAQRRLAQKRVRLQVDLADG